MFCKKGVLKNFAKFTGKQVCQRLFFNKVAGLGLGLYEVITRFNTPENLSFWIMVVGLISKAGHAFLKSQMVNV